MPGARFLVGTLLVFALPFWLGLAVVRGLRAPALDPAGRVARRRSLVATALGIVAGFVLAGLVSDGSTITSVAAAPALFGIGALVGGLAGSTRIPVADGQVRQVVLDAAAAHRSGRLVRWAYAAVGAGIALLALSAALSAGGSLRRGGASVELFRTADLLALGAVLVGLAAALTWGMRFVEERRAFAVGDPAVDGALREAARLRIARPAAIGSLLTTATVALVVGPAMNEVTQGARRLSTSAPRPPWDWFQNAGFAVIALGVLAAVLGFVAMFTLSPRLRPQASPSSARSAANVVPSDEPEAAR